MFILGSFFVSFDNNFEKAIQLFVCSRLYKIVQFEIWTCDMHNKICFSRLFI